MRVLFLTHRLPYATDRGDRIRAYHMLDALRAAGEVDLLSFVHDRDEAAQVEAMRHRADSITALRVPKIRNLVRGARSLPTRRPLTHALLNAPGTSRALHRLVERRPPDIVLAFCSGMARLALESPLRRWPFVLDFVDVDSQKWSQLAKSNGLPRKLIYAREAHCLGRFEAAAARAAEAALVVNDREAEVLARLAPGARIEVVENGIDATAFAPPGPPPESTEVVFCGVMDYAPNVEGVCWFLRDVWPRIRAEVPAATFTIVGRSPAPRVRELNDPARGVTVTGGVPEVQPYLWRSAVSVAPLHTARGVQNKVLEAIAAGLPCVVSRAVEEGLPPEVASACDCSDEAQPFADAVIRQLRESPATRRTRAESAQLAPLAWAGRMDKLIDILREIDSRSAAGRAS